MKIKGKVWMRCKSKKKIWKINRKGPGWKLKIKTVIIYQLMLGKLMLLALHFVSLLYGNAGKKGLLKHDVKSTEHLSNKKNYWSTTLLPLHCRKPASNSSSEFSICARLACECAMLYGVIENVHTTGTCPSLKENNSYPIVSVSDCKHHLEAYILFCRKFIMPLFVPKLLEFSQFLSRDSKALSQLQINQAAASYKPKHGLSVCACKKLVVFMKKYPFSISIDKCTSNNNQKVYSILVSYFDIEIGESVVQH